MKKIIIISVLACFGMLSGCSYLQKDYDFNTDPAGVKDFNLLDYFENDYDDNHVTFCRAIRKAGLADRINAGNVTCLVPTNAAFISLLGSMGYADVDEVDDAVLKALMQYLIFPGDYRALTMEPNVNNKAITLSGDPIWIMRNPSAGDKYRIHINNTDEISSSYVQVTLQDFLFRNHTVAQVVPSFPVYMPTVTPADPLPEDFDFTTVPRDTLWVTDDTHIHVNGNNKTVNFNANGDGLMMCGRESQGRVGLLKFTLKEITFSDIYSATIHLRLRRAAGYLAGDPVRVNIFRLMTDDWTESTVTWNEIANNLTYPLPLSVVGPAAGSCDAIVPSGGGADANLVDSKQPTYLSGEIAGSIIQHYADDADVVSYALLDASPGVKSYTNSTLYLYQKDNIDESKRFTSYISLIGMRDSDMTLARNQPVVPVNGVAILNPDEHFAMSGYTSNNISFRVISLPSNGILTLYGIPAAVNATFTQAEMEADAVKYLQKTPGGDSFTVRALDNLVGVYPSDLTVTIQ